jgi:hypothetical protein
MNLSRIKRIIAQAVSTFELDLSGFAVLTEAATGWYVLTPMIAALARADFVLALTRDSRYGKVAEVRRNTMKLAGLLGVEEKIDVIADRSDDRIGQADIITNLGFVRPLNAAFLDQLKKTAAIALMWETWEFRPEDMDIEKCRQLGLAVLGTNEHHPDLRIFDYIGYIALKLLFEAGIEVLDSRVAVLGRGEFADQVLQTLGSARAEAFRISAKSPGERPSDASIEFIKQADAIVIAEHHSRDQLIGESGFITAPALYELNPGLAVVHVCGAVDRKALDQIGLNCWPDRFAPAGHMSAATDYVGPTPLVKLHTAGLKVGERLAAARKNGASAFDAEINVLANLDLAQGFAGYHDL